MLGSAHCHMKNGEKITYGRMHVNKIGWQMLNDKNSIYV